LSGHKLAFRLAGARLCNHGLSRKQQKKINTKRSAVPATSIVEDTLFFILLEKCIWVKAKVVICWPKQP